jgi:TolB protein
MSASDADRYCISDDEYQDGIPSWSPDSQWIAFRSEQPDGTWGLFISSVDGSALTRLVPDIDVTNDPIWSPDGMYILFQTNRDGNMELYMVARDNTNLRRLTDNTAYDGEPFWSP